MTHVVVAWYALELRWGASSRWAPRRYLRYSDLDFVLHCLRSVYGASVLPHLVFAVTFCDPGRKAKAYRSGRDTGGKT